MTIYPAQHELTDSIEIKKNNRHSRELNWLLTSITYPFMLLSHFWSEGENTLQNYSSIHMKMLLQLSTSTKAHPTNYGCHSEVCNRQGQGGSSFT